MRLWIGLVLSLALAPCAALPSFFKHPLGLEVAAPPVDPVPEKQPVAVVAAEPVQPAAASATQQQQQQQQQQQGEASSVEQVAQQGEASVDQVEADLKRMGTFSAEVRRTLDMHDKTNRDITQAISYFRRQTALNQDSRDQDKAKLQSYEMEVAELQRRIKSLEADKKALQADKATLTEANNKVLKQLSSMFAFGQSVQSGLAFQGLAPASNSNASSA